MATVIEQANTQCLSLKQRFLQAVKNGELGKLEDRGIVITMKEFRYYFSDIKTQYVASFLPASTIEPGRSYMTRTKFVIRLKKGVYLLHSDALQLSVY